MVSTVIALIVTAVFVGPVLSDEVGALTGVFVLEVKGSGTCLHYSETSSTTGLLDGWACDPEDTSQQLEADYVSDTWFRLRNADSHLCVEVPSASKANHVATTWAACQDGDHQLWKQEPKREGWFMLVAKHSLKCLDLEHGIKTNGTTVLQWTCHPSSRWQFANQLFRPI